jgi:hypothetical protein
VRTAETVAVIVGDVLAAGIVAFVLWWSWVELDRWCGRRRRARRRALEARMRAWSRCGSCGAVGAAEFRARTAGLLGELAGTDEAAAARALIDYGRRAAAAEKGR